MPYYQGPQCEDIAPEKGFLKTKVITFCAEGQIGFVTKIIQTVTQTHPSSVGCPIAQLSNSNQLLFCVSIEIMMCLE